MSKHSPKIAVENVNVPGKFTNVNAIKYAAMKVALLKVLPNKPPGRTQKEMLAAVKEYLIEEVFPGGATSAWWIKTVQLDLEAKKVLLR